MCLHLVFPEIIANLYGPWYLFLYACEVLHISTWTLENNYIAFKQSVLCYSWKQWVGRFCFFFFPGKKQAEKWTPQIASVCLRLLSSGLRSLGWVYLLIALLNCNYSRQLFGSQHCFIGFINHTNYYPIENCNYPQTLTCQNVY